MRARNMQSLTDDVKRKYPGVTVYGIGDDAHKLRSSDHNEDDTTGSKAAQSDKDTTKEHRAIDIMVGPAFTKADGDALVAYLLEHHKDRLYGLIWHGSQWWRSTGFRKEPRTTDQHNDHVHVSGLASDDENAAGWLKESGGLQAMISAMFCAKGDKGEVVQFWQVALNQCGFNAGTEDGVYGDATAKAVGAARKAVGSSVTDGGVIDAHAANQILIHLVRHWQTPATPAPGSGTTLPAKVRIVGTLTAE